MTTEVELPGQQGAADRFVARYGHMFRYVPPWRKYIAWDGRRWSLESGDVLMRECWQRYLKDAISGIASQDMTREERADALKAAKEMNSASWEGAMVQLCQPRTRLDHHELDADPWILNCANGILNLRTGTTTPHAPEALCTHLAPVALDPNAECPQWIEYLHWCMQGDRERVAYLQRFFGLCLTGDAEHELAHFFWGDGGNGKTTVVKTIEAMLGDYAQRAPAKMLMVRKHEAHATELARLCGCRLVTFAETKTDEKLDEQQLKLVASKDTIPARRMREDFWEFNPTHKSVLLTNHKPRIGGQDAGIWRRIRLVEWGARVADRDKDEHFGDRFMPELPGILRWAWEGLQAVLADGLRPPDAVLQATASYRAGEDIVVRWIAECCVVEHNASAPAKDLHESFVRWCDVNSIDRLDARTFGKRLTGLGYDDGKSNGARYRKGIGLPPRFAVGSSTSVAGFQHG